MIGLNGGLMGVRKVPTTGSASGLWVSNEQVLAKRAGIWPSVVSDPIPALSPILWYDFSDESTVTTSGTEVTQITDKGSRNWTLTKTTTGPQYVVGTNSLKCVDWGSSTHSNRLRNTDTTSTNVAEMYIVLDAAFGNSFPTFNGLVSGTSANPFLDGYFGDAGFSSSSGWDSAFVNGSASNTFSFILPAINSASLLRVKKSDNTAATFVDGFQIGMDRNNAGRGWYGLIGEVVCFSSVLSDTNRGLVQTWLGTKWGLTLS
jgi:hypothetical protein